MFDEYSKIDDYLADKLSETERAAFEIKLSSDKDLQKVVNDHSLYAVVADEIINDNLSNVIKDKQNLLNAKSRRNYKYGFILLMVLVLFIVLLSTLFKQANKGEKIYADLYSPPMGHTLRGNSANLENQIKQCYKGHILLDDGELSLAKSAFEESLSDPDLLCQEKALYYLALISVKENDFAQANKHLSQLLEDEDGGYEQKAEILLQRINEVYYE